MRIAVVSILAASLCPCLLLAQTPYSSQLRTDPAAGNVQGIQRFGRPLTTDPDQGAGFSYHVFPLVNATVARSVDRPLPELPATDEELDSVGPQDLGTIAGAGVNPIAHRATTTWLARVASSAPPPTSNIPSEELLPPAPDKPAANGIGPGTGETVDGTPSPTNGETLRSIIPMSPCPPPFDWTRGLRNYGPPNAPIVPGPESISQIDSYADTEIQSGGFTRSGLTTKIDQIYHQPLVQIKMRVVEVNRTDAIAFGSILEYVSREDVVASRTSGQTANVKDDTGFENVRSFSRFVAPKLVTNAATGTGALVNLTSEHINWLIQGLSTELSADVITAPEVVTLNGQNVEFVSGDKLPFQLGQNVIQGTNNNIQQVFYKHVGTMVSVTPRIVSWGFHGEGKGERTIQASDVVNWSHLVKAMRQIELDGVAKFVKPDGTDICQLLSDYEFQDYIPFSVQSELLLALNNYSKSKVERVLPLVDMKVIDEDYCARCTNWKPEECTIDLAVVVRLSDGTPATVNDPDKMNTVGTISSSSETNIRAVANVIQVKSGHGVVMAGLIGEREGEELAKVPILGDLPLVGVLFRSKSVGRTKTEVLIFIEARVLDRNPCVARAESSSDFQLGRAYVEGEVLDNPLEIGMHRIGFGTYLPPTSHGEEIYWEKHHREIRKVRTHVGDVFGP